MNLADQTEDSISGAAAFVHSELFSRTFRDGMALVEDTANYLDGEGRQASKSLSRGAALSYAGASMRLTTQLMQIASWLLVLRAVREGDMTIDEATEEKYRLAPKERPMEDALDGELPNLLITLIDSTNTLHDRIARLDSELFTANNAAHDAGDDVASQQRALLEAFSGR
jgi:regulator of CtrA degradation